MKLNRIVNWFKKKSHKPPEAGENWFIPERSPWPSDIYMVTILDTKDGWVRYSFGKHSDERMDIKSFMRVYKLLDFSHLDNNT